MTSKGSRTVKIQGLFGSLQLARGYYYCGECQTSATPADDRLGLVHRHTRAALEVISLAGVLDSFSAAAKKILPRFCGLNPSPSLVERLTESVGNQLGESLASGQVPGADQSWDWYEDTEGRSCAYVSADATGVGQQAPDSGSAEGRMVFVGLVSNPVPADWEGKKPETHTRYVTSVSDLSGLGVPLRSQAGSVGMDRADRWLALSDGGSGLEEFFEVNFPGCEIILDFYHAAEHVCEFVKLFTGGKREWCDLLSAHWCHQLKHEGGQSLLKTLELLELSPWPEVEKGCEELLGYLRNHVHKMDYGRYQRLGWHIGSGSIESACKNVVGRLKGPGMRWNLEGTQGMCHLRALYKSEPTQWAAFW